MTDPQRVRLDLNSPRFQQELFQLSKDEQRRVLKTLEKLSQMAWLQIYNDRGLNWEAVLSRKGPGGERIYSLRISQKIRALALREGEWLRFLSLHPDHDSAYRR